MTPPDRPNIFAIARALSTTLVLERHGARIKRNRFSPCPACLAESKRGVAIIHKTDAGFWCSKCNATGSTVDLILYLAGIDPKAHDAAAIDALHRELGTDPPEPMQARPRTITRPGLSQGQIEVWGRTICDSPDIADDWLRNTRGIGGSLPYIPVITDPHRLPSQRPDLRSAAAAGPCAVFPLRSTHPDRIGQLTNMVIRPLIPIITDGDASKPWKAKCLNWGDNTTRDTGYPLCYGDPYKALSADTLVIVEGAVDQITAQSLLGSHGRALGAFCADDLASVWSPYLRGFTGRRLILIPHYDTLQTRCLQCRDVWRKVTRRPLSPAGTCVICDGPVETKRVGIEAMRDLWQQLRHARTDWKPRAPLIGWQWDRILPRIGWTCDRYEQAGLSDINDLCRLDVEGPRLSWPHLRHLFHEAIRE